MFSDNNGIRNYEQKTGKFTNSWTLNSTILNKLWVKEEIKKKLASILY